MKNKETVLIGSLVGAVLILVAVLAFLVKGNSGDSIDQIAAATTAVKRQAALATPQAGSRPIQKSPANGDSGVVVTSGDAGLVLQSKEMETRAGNTILRFRVTTEPRCELGDIDVIKKELKYSPNPRLLLSLESLIPGDQEFKPILKTVTDSEIREGYRITFTIPSSKTARHLGLFLCSDADEANSCFGQNKVIEDLNTTHNQLLKFEQDQRKMQARGKRGATVGIEAVDRIYFFNYLLLESSTVTVLNNQMPESGYLELEQHLRDSLDPARAANLAQEVKTLNVTLRSISAEIEGNQMSLNMPRFDPGICELEFQAEKEAKKQAKKEPKDDTVNDISKY